MSINSGLLSAAMRVSTIAIAGAVTLTVAVSASAATITLHSHHRAKTTVRSVAAAAPLTSPLSRAVLASQPEGYWPLNDQSTQAADRARGRTPLTVTGSGAGVLFGAMTSPPGADAGGSVQLTPGGRTSGKFLHTAATSTAGVPSSLAMWFRMDTAAPRWAQTLVVDNGKARGVGFGLFLTGRGHLVFSDVRGRGAVDLHAAPLNDGQWHLVVWTDTSAQAGHAGADVYVDGDLTSTVPGAVLPQLFGARAGAHMLLGMGNDLSPTFGQFKGNLSNVAIFDHLLTAAEVSSIWSAGSGD